MQKLLLVFFLFFSQILFAQRGMVYVKKKGFKKVRTFAEETEIGFKTKNDQSVYGILALVKKDSIFVNGNFFSVSDIRTILLKKKEDKIFPTENFLWTTAGVALSTAGITLAKWEGFNRALVYSAGLGYTNFLLSYLKFKRKKYSIGKKFSLQTLDLHF